MRHASLVATAVAFALAVPGVSAADPDAVRDAAEQLDAARDEAGAAQQQLDALAAAAQVAIEDYNEANAALDEVLAEVRAAVEELDRIQARVRDRQASAGDFARRLYQHGSAYELEALLTADDPSEVQARIVYLKSAARAQLNVVAALKADRRVELAQLSRLQDARNRAAQAEARAARQRDAVEQLLAAQAGEVRRLEAEVRAAESAHERAVREERERLERERLERERREAERRAREAAAAAAAAARQRAATPAPPTGPPPPASEAGQVAVDAAMSQLGDPYEWGGSGPDTWDCSGLTSWAWRQAGVYLPHSSRMQYAATARVQRADIAVGDLLFFGSPIHHVGMYIGDGRMIEAPYTGSHVRLNDAFRRSDLVGIGRPIR